LEDAIENDFLNKYVKKTNNGFKGDQIYRIGKYALAFRYQKLLLDPIGKDDVLGISYVIL
jgi:hypothetical protein